MEPGARIYVAGHRGMVGSAIQRRLEAEGYTHLLSRTRNELDLQDQAAVDRFFQNERPEYVILAAAKVGGVHANRTYPAEFIHNNLRIQTNVIDAAYRFGAARLLFLGSSCIYPKHAPQPMREEHLLTGDLEPTNRAYAVAKIAGLTMCRAYREQYGMDTVSLMPTNLYGPNDNFDLETAHVLPALLRKIHEAREQNAPTVEIWGTGNPRREFLHADDLANAALTVLRASREQIDATAFDSLYNVGCGEDLSIGELAELICSVVGYKGELVFDPSMPDGTPRKLLDISRIRELGWQPSISLEDGLRDTYAWYVNHPA